MRLLHSAAVLAAVVAAQPVMAGRFATSGFRVPAAAIRSGGPANGFRFVTPATPAAPVSPLRHRPNSSMTELYPLANSGFHLSAGPRLFARRATTMTTWASLGPTQPGSRVNSGINRSLYRRVAPVMTAGYTVEMSPGMTLGVEGGAIDGRLFSGPPGVPHHGGHGGSHNAANPLVQMVLGFDF